MVTGKGEEDDCNERASVLLSPLSDFAAGSVAVAAATTGYPASSVIGLVCALSLGIPKPLSEFFENLAEGGRNSQELHASIGPASERACILSR